MKIYSMFLWIISTSTVHYLKDFSKYWNIIPIKNVSNKHNKIYLNNGLFLVFWHLLCSWNILIQCVALSGDELEFEGGSMGPGTIWYYFDLSKLRLMYKVLHDLKYVCILPTPSTDLRFVWIRLFKIHV